MRHMQSHHNTYERIHSWRLNIHNSPTRTRRNNRAHDREDQSPRTPFTLASFSCSPGESTRTVLTDMVLSGRAPTSLNTSRGSRVNRPGVRTFNIL